jgi:hypothetical protein
LDGLFPGLLGSPKASCAGQIGQFEKSNLDRSEVQPSLQISPVRLYTKSTNHERILLPVQLTHILQSRA